MKRIIIICEGQTEKEFCADVLYPFFLERNILLQCPLIKKSGGGIIEWLLLKKQIETHLKQDQTAIVTLFIDFYGIKDKHQFPSWDDSKIVSDKNNRMNLLEDGMKNSIEPSLAFRFIPYLQLHEFEGLLFNNIDVFLREISAEDILDKDELEQTIIDHPNPELLNDTPQNAPSYRLLRLINGYNKVVYGAILAKSIGLSAIRDKCPRFNHWISTLERI